MLLKRINYTYFRVCKELIFVRLLIAAQTFNLYFFLYFVFKSLNTNTTTVNPNFILPFTWQWKLIKEFMLKDISFEIVFYNFKCKSNLYCSATRIQKQLETSSLLFLVVMFVATCLEMGNFYLFTAEYDVHGASYKEYH